MKLKNVLTTTVLCLSLVMLTGCGSKSLNLEKVKENVEGIKAEKFSRPSALNSIWEFMGNNPMEEFNLIEIGLNYENLEEVDGSRNYSLVTSEDGYSLFIGKASKGKSDALKKELDTIFKGAKDKNNLLVTEIDGYTIYLNTTDNEAALKAIKFNGYDPLFGMLMYLDDDSIESILGIKASDVDEYVIGVPMTIISSESYFVIKPAKGKTSVVSKAMKEYFKNQEEMWKTYLVDQYDLVKKRKETNFGDYLIYIVSTDNSEVLKQIKNATK